MPDRATIDHALSWLKTADGDLQSAIKLARPPDPVLETAVYHCQQAAEKAIKAVLAVNAASIPLKHDIRLLIRTASAFDLSLENYLEYADALTTFAIEYRYPNTEVEPLEITDVERMLQAASAILDCAKMHVQGVSQA